MFFRKNERTYDVDREIRTAEVIARLEKITQITAVATGVGAAAVCGIQAAKSENAHETIAWGVAAGAFGTAAIASGTTLLMNAFADGSFNRLCESFKKDYAAEVAASAEHLQGEMDEAVSEFEEVVDVAAAAAEKVLEGITETAPEEPVEKPKKSGSKSKSSKSSKEKAVEPEPEQPKAEDPQPSEDQ